MKIKNFYKVVSFITLIFFVGNVILPPSSFAFDQPQNWHNGGQQAGGNGTGVAGAPQNNQQGDPPQNNASCGGDPVYQHSGEFFYDCTDLVIPGRGMDVAIRHVYSSGTNVNGQFGFGWTMSYYARLKVLTSGNVNIIRNNRQDTFTLSGTSYTPPAGVYESLIQNANGTWTLTKAQGEKWNFDINGNLSSIVDRNANTISFTYDPAGLLPVTGTPQFGQNSNRAVIGFDYRLTTITDTVGRAINFFYNPDGRLERITDYSGRSVTFTYDPVSDDLLTLTRPATPQYLQGLTKTFTYIDRNLETITDPKNQTFTTNHYDANERVQSQDFGTGTWQFDYSVANRNTVTDRNGNVVRYDFNANGNMTRKEEFTRGIRTGDPASYITTYAYNSNMEMTSVTYPRGNGVKFVYDETNPSHRARGNLLSIRRKTNMAAADNNTNDIVVNLTYETLFNQVKTITDPRGQVTTLVYDYELPTNDPRYATRGNVVEILQPTINSQIPVTRIAYNAQGQPFIAQDPNGIVTVYNYYPATGYLQNIIKDPTGINAATAFTYDQWGNLDIVTDAENHVTNLDFNELGWLIRETNPLNFVTRYSYDKNGNVERIERQANAGATSWQTSAFSYDVLDKLQTITDPLNRLTTLNYDDSENMTSVVDAENHTTDYQYDERNLIYKVLDANTPTRGVTEYAYDNNGNLRQIKDANAHATDYVFDLFDRQERLTYADTKYTEFVYDKNSNMTRVTQGQPTTPKVVQYGYDNVNNLITKTFPSNAPLDITYGYDLGSRLTLARHTTPTNPLTNYSFTYDNLNRVRTNTQAIASLSSLTLSYEYDKVGNRTKVTYPSGKVVDYTFDANNRMDIVKVNNANLLQYGYDPLDRRTTKGFFTTPIQGSSYAYDLANQLTSVNNALLPSTIISRFDYTLYDNVGNRKTMDVRRGTNPIQNFTYGYNSIYELSQVAGSQSHTYQHDLVGNRTNVDNVVYQPNNINQYTQVGPQTYQYSDSGNLANDGVNAYIYDEENRLSAVSAQSSAYAYDGFNRRVSKTVNGVTTYYISDGDHEIEERDSTGALLADYVYGDSIDEVLTMSRGGSTYYYHHDGLGSVTDLTSSTGAVVESYTYDVYGNVLLPSSIGNPYLFTGRRLDAESGIYYYRARMYSPTIGRFLQRDPLGYVDSMNLFSYVKNNPVNWIDPLGLCGENGENDPPWWRDPRFYNEVGEEMEKGYTTNMQDLIGLTGFAAGGYSLVGNIPKGIGYRNDNFLEGGRIAYRWANQWGSGYGFYNFARLGAFSSALAVGSAALTGWTIGETINAYYWGYRNYREKYR